MATEGISWNETMDIMKDLTQLYSADNSHVVSAQSALNSVQSVAASAVSNLDAVCSQKEQEVDEAKKSVEMANTSQHAQIMMGLEAEKEALLTATSALEQEKSSLTQSTTSMEAETASVGATAAELIANNTAADIARVKHAISLYANVTSIKFDYGNVEGEGVLSGTVSVPETATVERFRFDRGMQSEFDVANGLWGVMEGRRVGVC